MHPMSRCDLRCSPALLVSPLLVCPACLPHRSQQRVTGGAAGSTTVPCVHPALEFLNRQEFVPAGEAPAVSNALMGASFYYDEPLSLSDDFMIGHCPRQRPSSFDDNTSVGVGSGNVGGDKPPMWFESNMYPIMSPGGPGTEAASSSAPSRCRSAEDRVSYEKVSEGRGGPRARTSSQSTGPR